MLYYYTINEYEVLKSLDIFMHKQCICRNLLTFYGRITLPQQAYKTSGKTVFIFRVFYAPLQVQKQTNYNPDKIL